MMYRALALGLVTLIPAPAAAGQDPESLDREIALTAEVEALARDALMAVAPGFVEVERPTFSGMLGPDHPLTGLRFATAPESAGWPGLCRATTAWIDLVDRHAPIQTSTVYKIVGDLSPLPDMWNEAYGVELEGRCAAAGRVIPTDSADFGQTVFFTLQEADQDQVWSASRALQRAISGAAAGMSVDCIEMPDLDEDMLQYLEPDDPEGIEQRQNQAGCQQAAATVAGLSLDRLQSLDVEACSDAAGQSCVQAVFLRYAYSNHQALWLVTLRYRENADIHAGDVMDVGGITLEPSFAVYD